MVRQRLKGPERRNQILRKAQWLCAKKDFAGTTLDEIAKKVGVSRALIIQYFGSKEGLYNALIYVFRNHSMEIDSGLGKCMDLGDDFGVFRTYCEHILFKYTTEDRAHSPLRLILFSMPEKPELYERHRKQRQAKELAILEEHISKRIKQGYFKNVDPEHVATAFVAMITPLVIQEITEGKNDPSALMACVDVKKGGIMKVLIIYQSFTGNTEKVTSRIAQVLESEGLSPELVRLNKMPALDLYDYDLVFMGTPVIQWLPAKEVQEFIRSQLKLHNQRGDIVPKSPKLDNKYAVCYCTYCGPHTGIKEAVPAVKYMEQFFEHLRFYVLGEWYVVGEFHGNEVLSTKGVMGDTRGRPNEEDLLEIEKNTKHILTKLKSFRDKAKLALEGEFTPSSIEFLSQRSEILGPFKKLVESQKEASCLPKSTQELIKIALSVSFRCKDCLKFHILEALNLGLTEPEIKDAILCGTVIGGPPYLSFAFEVLKELNIH